MERVIIMGHTMRGCVRPPHSQLEWKNVLIACAFRCFYCAEILNDANMTKDHLVPLIRGGCECAGNLVSSCLRCNSMKKQKTVAEFLSMKPALVETSGEFYTTITSLEAICDPAHDPLLKAIYRMSESKAFPNIPTYREPQPASYAWLQGKH